VSGAKCGDDTLAYLIEDHHEDLPKTVAVITGSGGSHHYFRWPTDGREIRNNAGSRLGPGLDIRGDGGQVLAPPTTHPCGRSYAWEEGCSPEDIDIARRHAGCSTSWPTPPPLRAPGASRGTTGEADKARKVRKILSARQPPPDVSPAVELALDDALAALPGGRHDAAVAGTLALVRFDEAWLPRCHRTHSNGCATPS